MNIPKHYTIVSGKGFSKYKLVAFDNALLNAGIGDYNLVKVSSILPARCQYEKNIDIVKGSVVYAAYSTVTVKEKQKITTAVAAAIPSNDDESGVIFESFSDSDDAENDVCNMCMEAMENRNKNIKEIKSTSITVSGKSGGYVSGISAVIMW